MANRAAVVWLLSLGLAAMRAAPAPGYVPDERWSVTASGGTGERGTPVTFTWSFAPDGTSIPGEGASNLISYFDGLFNVTSTSADLTQRPWFSLFEQSFNRWSELGGMSFTYEPNDNGAVLQSSNGVLGVRGDIRLGGAFIDGPNGTLAYTWLPNSGDVVVDTGETNFFANDDNNYRALRNTIMHELGHAFGLLHIESSTDALLLEPMVILGIDGPQLDDIRGIHSFYGDALEKTNGGLGNGAYQRATPLGALAVGGKLGVGLDAAGGQAVSPFETDFVSIANNLDIDFFSFTVAAPTRLDVRLTPRGGVFSQAPQGSPQSMFDANSRNDLSLAVFAPNGSTLLGLANLTAAGEREILSGLELIGGGTYFVSVHGSSPNVQLYEVELSAALLSMALPGDYNGDGAVDAADYVVWRNADGQNGSGLAADGNADGTVNAADYGIWRANFGRAASAASAASHLAVAVPEPDAKRLFGIGALAVLIRIAYAAYRRT